MYKVHCLHVSSKSGPSSPKGSTHIGCDADACRICAKDSIQRALHATSNMESHFVILITIILGLGLAYVASTRDTRWWKSSQREPQKSRRRPRPRFQTVRISNIPRHIPRHILSEKINTLSRDSASSAEHNVIGLSCTPAAASILTQRFQVATVTFLVEPDLALLESSLRSELGIDASRLRIDSDFFGLTSLHGTLEDSTVE